MTRVELRTHLAFWVVCSGSLVTAGGCAAQAIARAQTTPSSSATSSEAPDTSASQASTCVPPQRAKRIWVGFADERFVLADFERAAVRSQAIVKLVRASACELGRANDADGGLHAALMSGNLELHAVVFTGHDLTAAEARLRPKAGSPDSTRFRLELEGVEGPEGAQFRIVRAFAEPQATTAPVPAPSSTP